MLTSKADGACKNVIVSLTKERKKRHPREERSYGSENKIESTSAVVRSAGSMCTEVS